VLHDRRGPRASVALFLLAASFLLPAAATAFIPSSPEERAPRLRLGGELSENSRLGFSERKLRLFLADRGPQVEVRLGDTWDVGWELRRTTGDFRNRWYSPELGRWLTPDPIGLAGGMNLYAAFNGDPVNHTDPSGESATVGGAIGGFIWGAGQILIGGASGYYFSLWGQNIVAGVEIGASIDVGLMSFGLAVPASGALGAAGFDALTIKGRPQEWGDFGKNQLTSGATGAVLGPAIGVAARGAGTAARWVAPYVASAARAVPGLSTAGQAVAGAVEQRAASATAWWRAGAAGSYRARLTQVASEFESGTLAEAGRLGGVARWHNQMQRAYRWSGPPPDYGVATRIRSEIGIRGNRDRFLHHWLIPQRSGLIPNYIKNQRWNLTNVSGASHAAVDPFFRSPASTFPLPFRPFAGLPPWLAGGLSSELAGVDDAGEVR
jgi:RHS repeat-associated protein